MHQWKHMCSIHHATITIKQVQRLASKLSECVTTLSPIFRNSLPIALRFPGSAINVHAHGVIDRLIMSTGT